MTSTDKLNLRGWCRIALILAFCLNLTACVSTTTGTLGITYQQLIASPTSMTAALHTLNPNLTVDLLQSGEHNGRFVRIVSLKLAGKPVILAISQTALKNQTFKALIAHADRTPIGTKLFAPGSQIKRQAGMKVEEITMATVQDPLLQSYLAKLGYTSQATITRRISVFTLGEETLDLIEYILPAIRSFTAPE